MANPFQVAPPNVLQALLMGQQGFDAGRKSMQDAAMSEAGRLYAAGDVKGAQAAASRGGSPQALMGFANLQNNDRDFSFRQTEAQRAQQNADRGFGLQEKQINATLASTAQARALAERQFQETVRMNNAQLQGAKVPAGFEVNPDGGLRPVKGGPQDPAYIADTRKGPNMSITDISKLSDEGGKLSNLTGFIGNFKDDYSGKPLQGLSNTIARNAPEALTGAKEREVADWWQGYDGYKNKVRNDLFGSALTPSEQAEWLKSDIHPGMPAALVKSNLARQKAIVENGIKRKAAAFVQGGYDPETVSRAYGIPLQSLGVQPKGQVSNKSQAGIVDWRTYFGAQQ